LKNMKTNTSRTFVMGLILTLLIASNHSQAAAPDLRLEQILDRIEKRYAGKGFKADFIQETTEKAMGISDFATGKVYVRFPGKMRWEYEKPEKRIFITDGQKLWVYLPADNQVQIASAPVFFRDGKGASFLSDIKLIRQKFEITLEKSTEDFFYELNLVPIEKTLDVSKVHLSVTRNTFTIVRVITYNSYGDENRIEQVNLQFDVPLDDALFSFAIPKGADVVKIDD